MNKKKILSLALVVLLIATISFGTLAWFNDADEIENTFMVATSDKKDEANDIFSVDIWEYVNGNFADKDQDGATFEKILPGSRFHKEIYAENTGAYDQWVRVHVSVTEAAAFKAALGESYDLSKIFEGHDDAAWTRYDAPVYDEVQDTLTYTYYLNYKLAPDKEACLFTTVVIPKELDQHDMAAMGGDFALKFKAEAVQVENLTAGTALDAFNEVNWPAGTDYAG